MQKSMITKEEITGMIGTAIFMVLLIVILLFSYFELASSSDELGGIPVMFGNMEEAGGYEEPPMMDIEPQPVEEIAAQTNRPSETPLITQDTEASIAVKAEERKREEERERQEQTRREEERRRQAEAERKRREEEEARRLISQQVTGAFGQAENANRGESEGSGTQGVSTGSSDQGATFGEGGIGFSLEGRGVGSGGLVKPNYTVDAEGTVIVNITVAPNGDVTDDSQAKGTFAPSELVDEAIKAARKTKFNAINSTNPQQGTITYKFNLN